MMIIKMVWLPTSFKLSCVSQKKESLKERQVWIYSCGIELVSMMHRDANVNDSASMHKNKIITFLKM